MYTYNRLCGGRIGAKEVAKNYMLSRQALQDVHVICVKIERTKERANDRIRSKEQTIAYGRVYKYSIYWSFLGARIGAKEVAKNCVLFRQALQKVRTICAKIERPKEQKIVNGRVYKKDYTIYTGVLWSSR